MAVYPDFVETCGLGSVTGIGGANCRQRHSFWPFIEGVSERTYTDKELANIDPPPFEYDGRTYTAYEATQMQRRIERSIRKQKRLKTAYEAAGIKEDATAANIKLRRLNEKYKEFSKAAGLPEQRDRTKGLYTDTSSLESAQKASLLQSKKKELARKKAPLVVLKATLEVNSDLVNGVIPKGVEIGSVRIIAGSSSKTPVKAAKYLAEKYGGSPLQWIKMGGIIKTDSFRYDVHWFELNGEHYEEKLKEVRKNEG